MSSPSLVAPSQNSTLVTPTLSLAVAVRVVVPDRVALATGAVREVAGAVVSAGPSIVNVSVKPVGWPVPCTKLAVICVSVTATFRNPNVS